MIFGGEMKRVFEEFCLFGGLIGIQFLLAGNSVLLSYIMSLGINPLSLVIFTSFSTFIILSPLSFIFERKKWPKKFTPNLVIKLILLASGGVTLFQLLMLKGIKLTSPTMATAMPNLAPGLIFVIAWIARLETVKLSCMYSKAKIIGTALCVIGAIMMSLMQGTNTKHAEKLPNSTPTASFDADKFTGSVYLMAAVVVLSTNIVLQATTLAEFPAPMSLCAITSLIGMFITALVKLIQEHKLSYDSPIASLRDMFVYSLLGGAVSGTFVSFSGWAMKKRGPVLVSMFSPVGTICSLVFSAFTLGEYITIGSAASMLLVFGGLYMVLWAKGNEGYPGAEDEFESEHHPGKKPLLD